MSKLIVKLGLALGCLSILPCQALTLNGEAKALSLGVCFDESSMSTAIPNATVRTANKQWVRDAIEQESWGYYTNLSFTGWNDCAVNPGADIHIEAGGAVSYGDTIELPFSNPTNANFQRYHVQSAAVHEIGHQLGFIHEHLRIDSTYYSGNSGPGANQKFRFRTVTGDWFTIHPDMDTSLCLTISSSNNNVTQEVCTDSNQQQFKFANGDANGWSNIQNRDNSNCLDILGGSTSAGASLLHWSCSSNDNQKFKTMEYSYLNLSESIYGIQVKHGSQLWLDIPDGSTLAGIQPIQYGAFFNDYTHLTTVYDPTSVMGYENRALRKTSFILLQDDIDASRIPYGNSGASKLSEYIVAKNSNKCFSFNSVSEGAQQACNSTDDDQKFRIIYLEDDEFRIVHLDSLKCLDRNESVLSLQNCKAESGSANVSQRFRLMDGESSDWTRIQSVTGNQCLDLAWGDITNGTAIGLWSCHSTPAENQMFKVVSDISDIEPHKLLKAKHSAKCLEKVGGDVKQYTCSSENSSQAFEVYQLGNGYYKIRQANTNSCFTVSSTTPASDVFTSNCSSNSGLVQQFELIPNAGDFSIKSAATGFCVDIDNASTTDGSAALQWYCSGENHQIFSFVED